MGRNNPRLLLRKAAHAAAPTPVAPKPPAAAAEPERAPAQAPNAPPRKRKKG